MAEKEKVQGGKSTKTGQSRKQGTSGGSKSTSKSTGSSK